MRVPLGRRNRCSLAGIRWGLDESTGGIPAEWFEALRGKRIVEKILAKDGIG